MSGIINTHVVTVWEINDIDIMAINLFLFLFKIN